MSLSDETKKLKEKIEKQKSSILFKEMDEYAEGTNTQATRQQLLRLSHYYYLLQKSGDQSPETKMDLETYWGLAREKIQKAKDYEGRWKEIAESSLIDQHNRAWNMAEYYYEKASKTLCQMMITVMDYILQAKADMSVLYKGVDRKSYFNLLDEIVELNETYTSCYAFLCAYDYCTEKIATFTGIKEYQKLDKEHERIIENGIPARVSAAIEELRQIAGEEKREYFIDIVKAYTPDPGYDSKKLEDCYKKAVSDYSDEIKAMTIFASFVIRVDQYYESL